MWFVCGLGNPGTKYQNTRHNIGFNFIDSIVKKYNFNLIKKDKSAEIFKGSVDGINFILLKPLKFMNASGPIVEKIINYYKIKKTKILIIHDDLDLSIGKVKIKTGGGNAGHNGLLSIDQSIGKNYKRLRIGIDHPGQKNLVSSYVLKKFKKEEQKTINNIIELLSDNFLLLFENQELLLNKISLIHKKDRDGI